MNVGTAPRLRSAQVPLQLQRLFEKRQVREIFGAAEEFFAGVDALQWKNDYSGSKPPHPLRPLVFITETAQPMHLIEEIDGGSVDQVYDGVRPDGCVHAPAQIQHSDILARGEVDPDICVKSNRRGALQDGPAHSGYLKPNFFRAERVYKSCERRNVSCRRHRSSGDAARLRANRCLSSSLNPRTRRSFLSTRAIFFSMVQF